MSSFLSPLGPVAEAQGHHLLVVSLLVLIAGLPVLVGAPLIYWRYRRGNANAAYRPDWSFSKGLEITMWGVPVAIVAALGVILWQQSHRYAPETPQGPAPLEIEAVGLNWKWLFIYPDERVASVGQLVLPADRPVTMKLTSDTVMQSFMVPALAGQLYAMPGMVTRLNLATTAPGETQGRNMQFNGNGFAEEGFSVRILPPDEYRQWLASAQASQLQLDAASYRQLAVPGSLADARHAMQGASHSGPDTFTMQLADPAMFDQVVARYHTGTPLPASSQPGTQSYAAQEVTP